MICAYVSTYIYPPLGAAQHRSKSTSSTELALRTESYYYIICMPSTIFIIYIIRIYRWLLTAAAAPVHRSKWSVLLYIETSRESEHHQGGSIASEPSYYHSVKCVSTSQYNNIIARI